MYEGVGAVSAYPIQLRVILYISLNSYISLSLTSQSLKHPPNKSAPKPQSPKLQKSLHLRHNHHKNPEHLLHPHYHTTLTFTPAHFHKEIPHKTVNLNHKLLHSTKKEQCSFTISSVKVDEN